MEDAARWSSGSVGLMPRGESRSWLIDAALRSAVGGPSD